MPQLPLASKTVACKRGAGFAVAFLVAVTTVFGAHVFEGPGDGGFAIARKYVVARGFARVVAGGSTV